MPDNDKKAAALFSSWMKEIDAARKREKTYRSDASAIVELYEGDKKEQYQFNILYSNTETMAPALYNTVPTPVVERRFKDEDPLGKMACQVMQRSLKYLLDDGMAEYATFDELMKSAVLEALVPGRGVTRFKYDAQIKTAARVPDETDPSTSYESVSGEIVCGEEVPWNRFLHGFAKKWKDVPWVGFEHFMTRHELIDHFGAKLGNAIPLNDAEAEDDDKKTDAAAKDVQVAHVYEIWDKKTKKVYFLCPQYRDSTLKDVDDPLGLSGFFPCPRPLAFVQKINTLTPVTLYRFYEEQAKELNAVTVRINKLIRALKVRGFYDATIEGLDKVLEAADNVLLPAENVAALQQGQSLEKAIWLFPLDKLITVLQQLYLQRNQVKQTIYEITGIADIMRGSTSASETLGAQEIKNQWGTLRLKKSQKEVARYSRDCLRIMGEIAMTKLSVPTLKAMTGLPYPTGAEKQQAQQVAAQAQALGQEVPPQLAQAASAPSFDEVLGMLRDDTSRSYRIDIETNSTVDAEATEDKQNIGELLNALAQFLNGVQPLVDAGSLPFEAAQGMMLAIVRRFRFGPELEDQLKLMKPPAEKPDPAAQKAQADMQMQQLDMQVKQQDMAGKQAEQQQKMQLAQMEMAYAAEEHRLKMEELRLKGIQSASAHQQKMEQITLQALAARQAAAAKPAPTKSKGAT